MLYASTLSPGEVHVARAHIEGEIDRDPQAHAFFDHRVPWYSPGDGLPEVTSESPVLEKYREVKG
jgi:hypothetical protein